MKKKYIKPIIEFHDVSLSTDFCADCELKASHDANVCPIKLDDLPYTLIYRENCESYAPEITDMICYHVPFADNNVFSS